MNRETDLQDDVVMFKWGICGQMLKGEFTHLVPIHNKYGCRCKASIVKRRGQVIYELVREPDV